MMIRALKRNVRIFENWRRFIIATLSAHEKSLTIEDKHTQMLQQFAHEYSLNTFMS